MTIITAMPRLRYLVVGTGRCGTVGMARTLTSVGVPCGHERVFGPDGIGHALKVLTEGGGNSEISEAWGLESPGLSFHLPAESSYLAAPFLDHPAAIRAAVIHLVRNPFHVLHSFLNGLGYFRWGPGRKKNRYEEFMSSHLPGLNELASPAERACHFWVGWNQMIEDKAAGRPHLRVKAEDGPDQVLDFIGVPPGRRAAAYRDDRCNAFDRWPKTMKPHPAHAPVVTPDELSDCPGGPDLRRLAARYGYEV